MQYYVGQTVKLNGAYFGSLAVITRIDEDSYPVLADIRITKAENEPHIQVGLTDTIVIKGAQAV
jgi:hypothetical protein